MPVASSLVNKTGATRIYTIPAGDLCKIAFPIGPQPTIVNQTNMTLSYDQTSQIIVNEYHCPPIGNCTNALVPSNKKTTLNSILNTTTNTTKLDIAIFLFSNFNG